MGGLILPGDKVTKVGSYLFVCPVCRCQRRYDDQYGPACTGPGATDDHPMTPMTLINAPLGRH